MPTKKSKKKKNTAKQEVEKHFKFKLKKEEPRKKWQDSPSTTRTYTTDDSILADINYTDPVHVAVEISANRIKLVVGPRDFEWDRRTAKLVGAGTQLPTPVPDDTEETVHEFKSAETVKENVHGQESWK